MRNHISLVVVSLAIAGAACSSATPDDAVDDQSFVERFRVLDESKWLVSDGWSNGDWTANDFRRTQVAAGPDGLTMTLERAPRGNDKRYSSGEIQIRGERFQYGYFEVRMQPPKGSGLVTGFFTYTGPPFGDPQHEVDIEILGRNTSEITLTYFSDGDRITTVEPLGFDSADELHTYGFEWMPGAIRWYVDGELIHEANGEELALPTLAQTLYLNLWNSDTLTDWVGPIRENDGEPWTLAVTCIAYAESYDGAPICEDA